MPPVIEQQLLSIRDVSKILGISTTTIWRHLRSESFPEPVKIGGLTRWRRSEIEAIFQPPDQQ